MSNQPRQRNQDVERNAGSHDQRTYAAAGQIYADSTSVPRTNGAVNSSGSNNSNGGLFNKPPESSHEKPVRWKERVREFTWTWFTMTMATGQLANVLSAVPLRFHGLYAIGCIFFIFNIVLFIFNTVMISTRFYLYPSTFKASLTHPAESLFVPAAVISLGTILLNITEYGTDHVGHWLTTVMVVMYWIYCGLAVCFTCGIYLVMWSTQSFAIDQMTPIWIFPAYPLLVIGPHAGSLSAKTGGDTALDIIIGGFIFQGIGFMVSFLVYSAFLYRLMTEKLPEENLRPGMFISVGPSGFTTSGVINMGLNISRVIPPNFMGVGALVGPISQVVAIWMGIFLWGLAVFFFIVSLGAHWSCIKHRTMRFAMTWYSYVFPNTGLTTATFAVAKALDSQAIRILGCVFTVLLIITWACVFCLMIRAVINKKLLWPQKQEDDDEDGWNSRAEQDRQRDGREGAEDRHPGHLQVQDNEPGSQDIVYRDASPRFT